MKQECCIAQCVWSEELPFCKTLTTISVPLKSKWPFIILYLRGIQDASYLSEVQKARMQEQLRIILEEKNFSDENYERLLREIFAIMTLNHEEKIKEISKETNALAKEMQDILSKRREQVEAVSQSVEHCIDAGEDPVSTLATLRSALKNLMAQLERDAKSLAELTHKDSLTGLANRRCFDSFLSNAVNNWLENELPVSLILLDIDHFKVFNDTYGHLVGDQVLCNLGQRIKHILKASANQPEHTLAARYGGEEFAVILQGEIANKAPEIAEDIRNGIQKRSLLLRNADGSVAYSGLKVTVSVGVAAMWSGWQSAHLMNLIDFADKALYFAKHTGRNCCIKYVPKGKSQFVRCVN